MKRVIVSVEEGDLKSAGDLADRLHVPRSEVFRRALRGYVAQIKSQVDETHHQQRLKEIFASMDDIALKLAKDRDWDPIALTREWRERGRRF